MTRQLRRLASREDLLATVSEKEWQRQVLDWASAGGWHGVHVKRSSVFSAKAGRGFSVYDGIHTGRADELHDDRKGIPDLFLVHPERRLLVLPELKTSDGRVAPDQQRWQAWLALVEHVSAPVWRPMDERHVRRMLMDL